MKNPTNDPELNKRVDFWLSWMKENMPNNYCEELEESFIELYITRNAEYQTELSKDKDRKPLYKVGDKVIVKSSEWFEPNRPGKITMVGELDNDLFAGIPFDPEKPRLVYGYSVEVVKKEYGTTWIYKGVPEFYLILKKGHKSRTSGPKDRRQAN